MRNYTAEKYIKLVKNISDPILQIHMSSEEDVIRNVRSPKQKTFIDLGAGYGRVLPLLASIARNVFAIEINESMLLELRRRCTEYKNTKIIKGDIQKLSQVLKGEDLINPVLLLLQNTLGTIEGNWRKVLKEMRQFARGNKGEIIISFFRQEALNSWGIRLYNSISGMTGAPDLSKTNFEKGLFVSRAGYTSKWRSKREIEDLKDFLGGNVVNEVWTENFVVLHLQFAAPYFAKAS